MSTVLEAHPVSDTAPAHDTTRITFREIRERTFRTLRVLGASSAQARAATEQVVFAELHHGTGLSELIDALTTGPWGRVQLSRTEGPTEAWAVECPGAEHVSALRHGTGLLDLMAAEPKTTLVVHTGLTAFCALLDEPLARAAMTTGRYLTVWENTPRPSRIRAAAPDGSVASGTAHPEGAVAEMLSALPQDAVVIQTSEHPPVGALIWRTADEQRTRRHQAATEGILVHTPAWQRLGAIAQTFLVPEQ